MGRASREMRVRGMNLPGFVPANPNFLQPRVIPRLHSAPQGRPRPWELQVDHPGRGCPGDFRKQGPPIGPARTPLLSPRASLALQSWAHGAFPEPRCPVCTLFPPLSPVRSRRNTVVAAHLQPRTGHLTPLSQNERPLRLAGRPWPRGAGRAFRGHTSSPWAGQRGPSLGVPRPELHLEELKQEGVIRNPDGVCSEQGRPNRHAAWLCDFPSSRGLSLL